VHKDLFIAQVLKIGANVSNGKNKFKTLVSDKKSPPK